MPQTHVFGAVSHSGAVILLLAVMFCQFGATEDLPHFLCMSSQCILQIVPYAALLLHQSAGTALLLAGL